MEIIRIDSKHKDFIELVKLLDADLAVSDGDDHDFYDQFNKLDRIKHAVVFYENDKPLGCGAIKQFEPNIMEVKRMFTLPESRGKGVASQILIELENWAKELNFEKLILETGINQPAAIALYKKCNFKRIPNYGQYTGIENSFCFEKMLGI